MFGALAHYRASRPQAARQRLADTMLQNLYLLPFLFHELLPKQAIWHPSNFAQPEYLWDVAEFLILPTAEERAWIKQMYLSTPFTELRDTYLQTYGALLREQDIENRGRILRAWNGFLDTHSLD